MSKLTLDQRMRTHKETKKTNTNPTHDVRMKATFRLAYALWRCGEQSIRDALDILDAGLEVAWPNDLIRFMKLGNAILGDVGTKLQQDKPSPLKRPERQNSYAPDDRLKDGDREDDGMRDLHKLNASVRAIDPETKVVIVKRNESEDHCTMLLEDVAPGDLIFTEATALHVSTAGVDAGHLFCDTCCSRLEAPLSTIESLYREGRGTPSETLSKKEISPPTTPEELADLDVDEYITSRPILPDLVGMKVQGSKAKARQALEDRRHAEESRGSGQGSSVSPTPTVSKKHSPKANASSEAAAKSSSDQADMHLCICGEAMFCSPDCFKMAMRSHHCRTCERGIEAHIQSAMWGTACDDAMGPDRRLLPSQLLLRLLAWADNLNVDPFDLPIIRVLRARMTRTEKVKSDQDFTQKSHDSPSWSYESHVIQPLQMLQAIDSPDASERVALCINMSDGRVINELFDMIGQHMTVTDACDWVKEYDEEAKFVRAESADKRNLARPKPEEATHNKRDSPAMSDVNFPEGVSASKKDRERIHFASLHPLCALLPIAEDAQDANVELVDFGSHTIACLPLAQPPTSSHGTANRDQFGRTTSFTTQYNMMSIGTAPNSPSKRPTITAGTPLCLAARTIRFATGSERRQYGDLIQERLERLLGVGSPTDVVGDVNMESEAESEDVDVMDTTMASVVERKEEDETTDDGAGSVNEGEETVTRDVKRRRMA
ncbi:hypothetical protein M8818_001795 [Zalaria obscura]|uniref:Uncharacterized protein n=1 Tax=Zalaria obscura TaxID=2024903 RepID=A0ACC3SLC5_9PEZI